MTISKLVGALTLTHQPAGALGNTAATLGGNMGAYLSVDPDTFFSGGADRKVVKLVMRVSNDGTTFSTEANSIVLIDDVDLSTTGTHIGTIPAASMISAPFYQMGINVDQAVNVAGATNTLSIKQEFSHPYG